MGAIWPEADCLLLDRHRVKADIDLDTGVDSP